MTSKLAPSSQPATPLSRITRLGPGPLIGLGVAAAAVALFYLTGTEAATNDTLQVMGFDPDRARLITSLISAGMAAAIVTLAGGATALGAIAGLAAGTAGFASTAIAETRAALAAQGTQGTFDPLGWLVSMVTFGVVFAVAGWAASILAREVRQRVIGAVAEIRESLRGADRGRARGRLTAASGVLLSIVVVVALLPTFGDMVNFDPDVHMRQLVVGGPAAGGPSAASSASDLPGATPASAATGGTDSPGAAPGSTGAASPVPSGAGGTDTSAGTGAASPGAVSFPASLVAGPLPSSLITPGAVSSARPWSSSVPTGASRVMSVSLPGPWSGGIRNTIGVDVYLPPGYDSGSARYPLFVIAPQNLGTWQQGMRLQNVLDTLITGGSFPPAIFVFVDAYGGPYPDSECADSFDGREWFDRFVGGDLIKWVDSNLRTIATPASRATLGFSQGGYCSAAFLAHHPDVFGSSIVLSGYFVAGIHSGTTPNAWRPFNDNAALVDAVSPMTVIPRIPSAQRAGMFYVMAADSTQGFYGPQMAKFASVLDGAGVAMAIFPTPLGHSWDAATQLLPTMLELVAGRMVQLGVFGPAS